MRTRRTLRRRDDNGVWRRTSWPLRRTKLDWKDYQQLPEDGKRYEILAGELYVSPSPTYGHQWIVSQPLFILYGALTTSGRGQVVTAPLAVKLSKYDVVQPDILFISTERLGITRVHLDGAPELVLEVLSRGTRIRDRGVKLRRYAKMGVPLYWIVDPFKNVIEVYNLEGRTYRQVSVTRAPNVYESPDLPGVRINLAKLFAWAPSGRCPLTGFS